MSDLFARLMSFSVLSREDARIVEALARRFAVTSDAALVPLALALRAPTHGHVCIPLDDPFGHLREVPEETRLALPWPGEVAATTALLDSGLARREGDAGACPLVLDRGRLYLARHHADELAVATFVRTRARAFETIPEGELPRLRARLDALFEGRSLTDTSAQKRAVATALLRNFTIITGGPGTGKTTTVVRLIALLASRTEMPLRVALLAPTGKAAARLAQSVRAQRQGLPAELRDRVPTDAKTIHRTLGASFDGRSFKHDARARLPVDVVVVDEASMVDLFLMARLFEAIPDHARVILLGDRDQLTSVEAGAVLADLTDERGRTALLSRPFAQALATLVDVPSDRIGLSEAPSLRDATVELETSHRFDPTRGIGLLSSAIHRGDVSAAFAALASAEEAVLHAPDPREVLPPSVRAALVAHAAALVSIDDDERALATLDHARVLSPLRRGPTGVEALNERFTRWLEAEGLLSRRAGAYPGLPILVTRNDPTLDLFNGDIGLVRAHGENLRALFESEDGERARAFALGRLPPWEPVHAMTVHKSQGSEIGEVTLVLPDRPSPVLTRELLYTAITRARTRVHVIGDEAVIERAIRERVVRATGLRDRLDD